MKEQEKLQTSHELIHDSPAHGIDICFQNIFYSISIPDESVESRIPCKKKHQKKEILKGISGIFKAGKMNAIMGASGAGKTTLLNILACRIKETSKKGRLLANNLEYNYDKFADFANYAMQKDILMETMTVRQTLEFTATLKINKPENEKKEALNEIISQLKLEKCLDTLIGGVLVKGVSGGEKKRASIAVELLSDPQVIFLDEPTSGLDSLTSYIIVMYLRKLAKKRNKTVIMTIHQPNSETYESFDNLTVLLEGKIIYQGAADQVKDYFTRNFRLQCPLFINMPDFFMSKIHFEDERNRERYPEYFGKYESEQQISVQEQIENRQTSEVLFRKREVGFFITVICLMRRSILNNVRNPLLLKAKLLESIFLALFVGGVYFNAAKENLEVDVHFRTISGFTFFIGVGHFMASLSPISISFPLERVVFVKEQDSKLYSTFSYFIARNTVEIPELILIPSVTVLIYYWMIGLASTPEQFFIHLLVAMLLGFAGSSIGLLLGSIIFDAKDIGTVVPIMLIPAIVFSGFFKNREDLPDWSSWIEYASPLKYGYIALLENQVKGVESNIQFLKFDVDKWPSIFILAGLGVFFRTLSLVFIWVLRKTVQ